MMSAIVIPLLVIIAASSGAMFKPGEWYDSLKRPSWTPPKWAFPVVWTILYAMIAYSGWLVWQAGLVAAFVIWLVQLVLNGLWSYFFFGRRQMKAALVDLVLMLLLIISYIALTLPTLPLAGLLFVPYLVWVCIAGALNLKMIQLNPGAV